MSKFSPTTHNLYTLQSTGKLFERGLQAAHEGRREVLWQWLQLYLYEGSRVTQCNQDPAVTHTHATILISVSGLYQIHCAFSWEWPGQIKWLYVAKCENLPYVTARSLFVLYKLSVSYLWPCCTLSSDIRRNRRDDVAAWRPKRFLCSFTSRFSLHLAWSRPSNYSW